jgi:hypothetical protein
VAVDRAGVGLDGIYILNMPEMDDAAFNKHLDKLISLELF